MRGGVNLEQAWQLTHDQRHIIMEIINANVERTQSSGLALL